MFGIGETENWVRDGVVAILVLLLAWLALELWRSRDNHCPCGKPYKWRKRK
jgi:hypothetical protein